jgi:hypothetical protein
MKAKVKKGLRPYRNPEVSRWLHTCDPDFLRWMAWQCFSELLKRGYDPAAMRASVNLLKDIKPIIQQIDRDWPDHLKLGPGESPSEDPGCLISRRPLYRAALPTSIAFRMLAQMQVESRTGGLSPGFAKAWNEFTRRRPWCKANARTWAKVLKPLFRAGYGADFQKRREFEPYIRKAIENGRKTEGDKQDAIWKCIVQSFVQLAPDEPAARHESISRTTGVSKM